MGASCRGKVESSDRFLQAWLLRLIGTAHLLMKVKSPPISRLQGQLELLPTWLIAEVTELVTNVKTQGHLSSIATIIFNV